MLAQRGGAELVALWAQLSSVMEVVSGIALAGLGTGLSVYVARTSSAERQRELLGEALKLGLALALPVALFVASAASRLALLLGGGSLGPSVLQLGAAIGCIAVVPGLINSVWLGQQRRTLMLAYVAGAAVVSLAAALLAPERHILYALVSVQVLPALVVLFVARAKRDPARFRSAARALRRYIVPSVTIGILSPVSTLAARAAVGDALSWHEAGVLQALWRVSDWVCSFAGGVLSVYYLPQLAAARGSRQFGEVLRRATICTLVPSAAVLALFLLLQRPLLAALYDETFRAPSLAVALVFAGCVLRIAAWVAMFGLYAVRRTSAVAIGELFSLPLFAVLTLATGRHLTLELAGAFWLVSYCAYLGFNVAALRRTA